MTAVVTDFARLGTLRAEAAADADEALQTAAAEFEALFIQSLLSSMRETLPDDSLFGDGNDTKLYEQMFDQQIARNIAGKPGIGLAELLSRQLQPGAIEPGSMPAVATLARSPVAGPAEPSAAPSPIEFVRGIWPYAQRAGSALGVDPRAIVAQAALETGWGQQTMRTEAGGEAYNYFGIKADSRWSGDAVSVATLEFRDGLPVREQARFRAYPSRGAAFDDYVAFIADSPRYAAVKNTESDIGQFARGLSDGGYATDPAYAEKLMQVVGSKTMRAAIDHLKFGGLSPMDSL